MRNSVELLSKQILKISVKIQEQTADCRIAAGGGDPETVKQSFQRDDADEKKPAEDSKIISLRKIDRVVEK